MKARIIEIEREEISPGKFRRLMWSNVPSDQLTYQDTQEFFNRTDELWPMRDVISSLEMERIQQHRKSKPNHFFVSISTPPPKDKAYMTDFSKN